MGVMIPRGDFAVGRACGGLADKETWGGDGWVGQRGGRQGLDVYSGRFGGSEVGTGQGAAAWE